MKTHKTLTNIKPKLNIECGNPNISLVQGYRNIIELFSE